MSPSHLPDNTLEIPPLLQLSSSTVKIEKSHQGGTKKLVNELCSDAS